MATIGTYCFDGVNFAQATSLYTDSALTNLAPDGYYAQGAISRRQLNGVLLNAVSCSSCVDPCGVGVNASVSNNGLFFSQFGLGADIGAIVVYIYAYSVIPDGILATYNSNTYNRLTCLNNNGSTITENGGSNIPYAGFNNQGTELPTYIGKNNTNLVNNSPYNVVPGTNCVTSQQLRDFTLINGTYVDQGTSQIKTVVPTQVGTASTSYVYTMVIPKTSASPSVLDLQIFAPICGTSFNYNLDCPVLLDSFQGSASQANTTCAANVATYYFVQNALLVNSSTISPKTNSTPEVGNWVFTTNTGSAYLNDTNTDLYYIIDNTTYIKVKYGVVIETGNCT